MIPGYWKYIISSLTYFCFLFQAYGQKTFQLDWSPQSTPVLVDGREAQALNFSGAVHSDGIPMFTTKFDDYGDGIRLLNPSYSLLTADEIALLPKSAHSLNEIKISANTSNDRNRKVITVALNTIRKNPQTGLFEKLTSFSLQHNNNFSTVAKTSSFHSTATTSVLASGDWYKVAVFNDAIYKIDYNALQNMGIDVNTIDPQNISIYGNAAGMLPQRNSDNRIDDLAEHAIFVSGESDGSFDQGDYILFYGQSPHTWEYDSGDNLFHHEYNLYSDTNFYFITVGISPGKRIQDIANLTSPGQTVTTYNDRAFKEDDLYNHEGSGRLWLGDIFNFTLTRSYAFNFSNIAAGSQVTLTSSVMSASSSLSSFSILLGGVNLASQSFNSPYAVAEYGIKGVQSIQNYSIPASSLPTNSSISATLTFNKQGNSSALAYLDYLELHTEKDLQLNGSQTHYRSIESTNQSRTQFDVGGASSDCKIWDVTDPTNVGNQLYDFNSSTATYVASSDSIHEYVIHRGTSFSIPTFIKRVANQDLHGIITPPTLLIVTNPRFLNQANQLANFKENTLGMTTEVATTDQIYNEFSGGAQDITAIRDFAKMLFDRSTSTDSLRYLLLLGDASYDYKNRLPNNTNFIPVYESRQSLHNIDSYSSDDYFGFLGDAEGYWEENPTGDHLLDIGIGRLPARSVSEAQTLVNKSINYSSNISTLGNWRNQVTFVADDGDGVLHMNHADVHAKDLANNYPVYNSNKIYLDGFTQISSPGGEVAPDANEAINLAIEKGTLIMNYTGHGGGSGWAQEAILTTSQLNKWTNSDKLPLFVTATCEFGRYDDPEKFSGAENLVANPDGGAIALVTTTRAVFAFSNLDMNEAIYDFAFEPIRDSIMPTLGDIIRQAKNEPNALFDINNRNFSLLGDPSLTLAYPEKSIVITKVNDSTVTASADTLKALSKVKIEGEVRSVSGDLLSNYNGQVYATIYDKAATLTTLGNEGVKFTFESQNNVIYEGLGSVTNGTFEFSFIVPKDISYQFDFGKISLYAKNNFDLEDAHGYNENIIIGGTADSIAEDDTAPVVELFMDDESFVFGGQTGTSTKLLALLTDDNGINISNAGIGHEITGILDGNEADVYVLNDFYTTELDDYKQGRVEFPFTELETGPHSLRVKAWDTHNNSGEGYIEFIVANDAEVALDNLLNYPNPFSTNTEFHFDHNRAGDDLEIQIQIYTISGRLIKTINSEAFGSNAHISGLTWDGKDDFGDKIAKGVYIYKVNVRSLTDGSKDYKIQRLVILN